jgi:hypothetical protein
MVAMGLESCAWKEKNNRAAQEVRKDNGLQVAGVSWVKTAY